MSILEESIQRDGDFVSDHTVTSLPQPSLRACVQQALDTYFAQLEGQTVNDLYDMVLAEVEAPLLETVMGNVRGNQTKAAKMLGINRGTLRKKLKIYGLN
ncbi:MAG: DNA-binding transcriptional regulator Fis [Pseudomonadota bacterium]